MQTIKTRVFENSMYAYLADHGSEIDYIAGTFLNDLTTKLNTATGLLVLSDLANTCVTVGWNYLDAIYDFMLASRQLVDERPYRQLQSKLQAALNLFSGIQLFVFSYNPPLTRFIGLSSPIDLAGSSFALSAIFDFGVACLELYNLYKELTIEGWVEEKIKKLNYETSKGFETSKLVKDIRSRIKVHAYMNHEKQTEIVSIVENGLDDKEPMIEKLVDQIDIRTAKHIERNHRLQNELELAFKESRTNVALKLFSAVGMTLLAITRFIDSETESYANLIMIGLATTTLVASAYVISNGEQLMDKVSALSHCFFSNNSSTTSPVEDDSEVVVLSV